MRANHLKTKKILSTIVIYVLLIISGVYSIFYFQTLKNKMIESYENITQAMAIKELALNSKDAKFIVNALRQKEDYEGICGRVRDIIDTNHVQVVRIEDHKEYMDVEIIGTLREYLELVDVLEKELMIVRVKPQQFTYNQGYLHITFHVVVV